MIDSKILLAALQKQVTQLEDDMRARCSANPQVDLPLRTDYDTAKARGRTALTYSAWRDEELTQIAVAWVLACVFVRFLEDNELIDVPVLAGPGSRLQRAKDEHEIFFRAHPTETEREYLEKLFTDVGTLPAMKEFFDRKHNPLWKVGPSGDAAQALLHFWQRTDPDSGMLVHDFTDPEWSTRFLGDLYQELSEAAKKKFALLQTPDFIESFILDRTLTPAIQCFGYQVVRMIDPTCGSGHFCIGGFHRLFSLWREHQPGENPRVLAQKALDGVYGVDLNPYAVAIARFRLLLAALKVCGVDRIRNAPDFRTNLAVGDSLLHGAKFDKYGQAHYAVRQPTLPGSEDASFRDELKHHYEVEDAEALHRILGQQYHAVVGNPPYITVKDRALSELYRGRYLSCHRRYSLSVPFMERFFDFAVKGDGTPQQPAGFVGQITSNSFMKREFGKKLIEEYLPRWDLTYVLDTAGAYIPGHGTPTVILLGKNQPPVSSTIRTVLGIAGEPATPADPARGLVWQAILRQIDTPGSMSEWVSAADSPRANFHRHPWSIGGGGAAELKEQLESECDTTLGNLTESMGFASFPCQDDVFISEANSLARAGIPSQFVRSFAPGDVLRDWQIVASQSAFTPYGSDHELIPYLSETRWGEHLWHWRTSLQEVLSFGGKTRREAGDNWWAWYRWLPAKYRNAKSIVFANIATHNHFVLDLGGVAFKQTSPVIKLAASTDLEQFRRLLGLLNSSTACFWMKQVCQNKGSTVDQHGARQRTAPFEDFYAFDSTKLARFPMPAHQPTQLPTALDKTSTAMQDQSPAATLSSWGGPERGDLRPRLASARDLATLQRRQLIAWQEELDWQIYKAFGLVEPADRGSLPEGDAKDAIPPEGIQLGERAFEIVLARRMAAGEAQSTWFERHGSTPITEVPRHWPTPYRELVERRIRRITDDPNIRLIEQPEYKRRWNTEPWDDQLSRALRQWLLNRLEGYFFEGGRVCELKDGFNPGTRGFVAAMRPHLVSINQLAEVVQADTVFLEVAELYEGRTGFSIPKLVRELVEDESVPNLPVHRYKESGLRNRRDWEQVWDLQRREDEVEEEVRKQAVGITEDELKKRILEAQLEKVGKVPVPPKYASKDFKKTTYWKLRGKLDVPKERWILYVGAERDGDPSPMIAWAGWNHLQQAQALAEYYLDAKSNQGWAPTKLKLLLAGLLDLLPWLKQWHNEVDPDVGSGLGDYFASFLDDECRALGVTLDDVERSRWEDSAEP